MDNVDIIYDEHPLVRGFVAVRCCCNSKLRGWLPSFSRMFAQGAGIELPLRQLRDGTYAFDSDGSTDEQLESLPGYITIEEKHKKKSKKKKTWLK